MPDHEDRPVSIDEAAWGFTAAECRLLLAMRQHAAGDATEPADMGRLFGELAEAAERLRAASCSPGGDEGAQRSGGSHLSMDGNGTFTIARQIGRR